MFKLILIIFVAYLIVHNKGSFLILGSVRDDGCCICSSCSSCNLVDSCKY